MSSRQLTTTSYAILGLLAVKPWATYDLAKQLQRSLHFFWPRAESNLYAEPKRLVEAGLAEAREEWNGDRKRTVYSITDKGRRAFRDWLATPPAPQRLESEAHLRILFGNSGTKAALIAALERLEADAAAQVHHFAAMGSDYARGEGPFPERIHVNALVASLGVAQGRALADWACWAKAEVSEWGETSTPDVDWALKVLSDAIEGASDAP